MSTQTALAPKPPETWLRALRQGTAAFEFCKNELFRSLAETNTALTDIDSSLNEIDSLELANPGKVALTYAKFWLNKIRSETDPDPRCRQQLKRNLKDFNISLEEIGATDADLGQ